MIAGMRSLFGQVSIPPSDNPGPFAGAQSWLGDTLSGLMWFVVHVALPAAIVVAVGLGIWAAVSGNRQRMTQSRSAFGGIVGAVALGLIAVVVTTWLLGRA